MTAQRTPIVTPRMIAGLLVVSVLSLLAYLVLSAYAPELRPDETDEANALSKSAVGYAGLQILFGEAGDVQSSRIPLPCGQCSLEILTPEIANDPHEVSGLAVRGAHLIVLPKWFVEPLSGHRGWVQKIAAINAEFIAKPISVLVKKPVVAQGNGKFHGALRAADRAFAGVVANGALDIENLQTISAPNVDPVIVDGHGHAVVGRIRGTQNYILSEPDLINNFGLHDRAKAYFAFNLVQKLRAGSGPIVFDLTLNGFRRSPNLLRSIFSPPFLGATFCAIMAAILLIFHTLNRFGAPVPAARALAFGKRALADNTAAVIKLMRREVDMAPRYAQAMYSLVAVQAGVSQVHMADENWLRTLEKRADSETHFTDLRNEAQQVGDKAALLRIAAQIYRWRQKVLHERH